jgi:hypothetical protein
MMRDIYYFFQVTWPFKNLSKPESYGLRNVYEFHLNTEENIHVGVWHFMPLPLKYNYNMDSQRPLVEHLNEYLKKDTTHPIFIYVHGILAHRSLN